MKILSHSEKRGRTSAALEQQAAGFTLIELMIVIAIITIIAAIAIPNMIRARMSANEAAAIGAVRSISTAESEFQTAGLATDLTGMGMYGTLGQLGGALPAFIDRVLASGVKEGYNFRVTLNGQVQGAPAFQAIATPLSTSTGNRAFYVDQMGMMTFTSDGTAPGPASPAVQ